MRYEGTFSCKSTTEEKWGVKETLAEADVARVRCARDEWKILGSKVEFTRTLFQSKDCENPLGRIQFVSKSQVEGKTLTLTAGECKLVKLSPGWIGENSGECMLNELGLHTPYALSSVYHCSNYVPPECKSSGREVQIESKGTDAADVHAGYLQILVKSGSKFESCERYEGQ